MMAGYQVHLSKPVEAQELIATVASLTGRTGIEWLPSLWVPLASPVLQTKEPTNRCHIRSEPSTACTELYRCGPAPLGGGQLSVFVRRRNAEQ